MGRFGREEMGGREKKGGDKKRENETNGKWRVVWKRRNKKGRVAEKQQEGEKGSCIM